jgi:hypothetical protein
LAFLFTQVISPTALF